MKPLLLPASGGCSRLIEHILTATLSGQYNKTVNDPDRAVVPTAILMATTTTATTHNYCNRKCCVALELASRRTPTAQSCDGSWLLCAQKQTNNYCVCADKRANKHNSTNTCTGMPAYLWMCEWPRRWENCLQFSIVFFCSEVWKWADVSKGLRITGVQAYTKGFNGSKNCVILCFFSTRILRFPLPELLVVAFCDKLK